MSVVRNLTLVQIIHRKLHETHDVVTLFTLVFTLFMQAWFIFYIGQNSHCRMFQMLL